MLLGLGLPVVGGVGASTDARARRLLIAAGCGRGGAPPTGATRKIPFFYLQPGIEQL